MWMWTRTCFLAKSLRPFSSARTTSTTIERTRTKGFATFRFSSGISIENRTRQFTMYFHQKCHHQLNKCCEVRSICAIDTSLYSIGHIDDKIFQLCTASIKKRETGKREKKMENGESGISGSETPESVSKCEFAERWTWTHTHTEFNDSKFVLCAHVYSSAIQFHLFRLMLCYCCWLLLHL